MLVVFFKTPGSFKSTFIPLAVLVAGLSLSILAFNIWRQPRSYYQDDASLRAMPSAPGRVVFLGDSITCRWNLAKYFPGKPYVNRGIEGQTTGQILARMRLDVVRLQPAAFIILAGTNDIAYYRGPQTPGMVENNIRAMCELAASHNVKIILCLITPVSDYHKAKQTERFPPPVIVGVNQWIESYARAIHAEVADYYAALVDDNGMLREGLSPDGIHPNARGYESLAPVAEAAIERALKKDSPTPDRGLPTKALSIGAD